MYILHNVAIDKAERAQLEIHGIGRLLVCLKQDIQFVAMLFEHIIKSGSWNGQGCVVVSGLGFDCRPLEQLNIVERVLVGVMCPLGRLE